MSFGKIVSLFLCFFILGVAFASFFSLSYFLFFPFLIFLLPLSFFDKKIFIFFLVLFSFLLGVWRYQLSDLEVGKRGIVSFLDKEENILLVGKIISFPQKTEKVQLLKVQPELIRTQNKEFSKIEGQILVSNFTSFPYRYGDIIEIEGKLKKGEDYLKKERIFALLSPKRIQLIERGRGNFLIGKIFDFKEKLLQNLNKNLTSPKREILAALLLGEKSSIPKKEKEKLNLSGLSHITAVSGMHLVIVANILMSIFLEIGFWRKTALYLTSLFIFFFVALWGFQVSALRAAIMAILSILAQNLGRMYHPTRALLLAAFLLLLQNPLLARYDIGFQLSFLATAGILYFGPVFEKSFLKRIFPSFLFLPLKTTLSAQIFTFPILASNFGFISLIAPLANILILPILPFLMSFGFAYFFFLWLKLLSGFFLWLTNILLSFLILVVDFFSQIPFAILRTEKIPLWPWFFYYLFLAIFLYYWQKKKELEFLSF